MHVSLEYILSEIYKVYQLSSSKMYNNANNVM